MYILGKRIDAIDSTDIKRLVENRQQETKSLDYKRDLKVDTDKDKKEFLFDITSMANTDGGVFIFGVSELKDEKGQNTGTPDKIEGVTILNEDKLTQQIEDIIRGNTDPSISRIEIKILLVDTVKVLVIGVAKSLGLPVMVTFNETNKFYRRRNSGKYTVDVYELNHMFMQNLILKERAENFRQNRMNNVRGGKVLPNLQIETSYFIHIIPFSFLEERTLDVSNAQSMNLSTAMEPFNLRGWDVMYNQDGFATWSGMRLEKTLAYTQLFRNGVYEIYTGDLFDKKSITGGGEILCMYGEPFIPDTIKYIKKGLEVLKTFNVEGPYMIGLSLFGIKGGFIFSTRSWGRPFLVDELILPQIMIPNAEANLYQYLKPIFDIVWQSVSENRSPEYKP